MKLRNETKLPWWVQLIGIILIAIGTTLGFIALVSPASFFALGEFSAWGDIAYVTNSWGFRNILMALILAFALYARDMLLLLVAFVMRFLVEVGDILNGLVTGVGVSDTGLVQFLLMFVPIMVLELLVIRWVWKQMQDN